MSPSKLIDGLHLIYYTEVSTLKVCRTFRFPVRNSLMYSTRLMPYQRRPPQQPIRPDSIDGAVHRYPIRLLDRLPRLWLVPDPHIRIEVNAFPRRERVIRMNQTTL